MLWLAFIPAAATEPRLVLMLATATILLLVMLLVALLLEALLRLALAVRANGRVDPVKVVLGFAHRFLVAGADSPRTRATYLAESVVTGVARKGAASVSAARSRSVSLIFQGNGDPL